MSSTGDATRSLVAQDLGLGSWLWRRVRIAPDRVALLEGSRRLTYAELATRVERLSGVLVERGVRPGDRVAYLGRNAVATFEVFFAAGLVGAVFVPLNTRLAGAEIRYMLDDCGAAVLVHTPDTDPVLATLGAPPAGLRHVLTTAPASCPLGGEDYESALESAHPAPPTAVGLDDPCLLLYTSGTTGRPKGAVITHGNLTWNTVNQLVHVDFASTDVALCIAPLFHVTGLNQVTLPTLLKGGTVVVAPRFDPVEVLTAIAQQRITGFAAVPTMLQMMCDSPAWESADLSSLRHVVYGGSTVEARVARAWLDRGVRLVQGYGMTEAAAGVLMADPERAPEHPVSAGVPHFSTDVALLSAGEIVPAAPGATGELLVRGPHVFGGYWGRSEATAEAFLDGWFRTGDVVRVGDDGWYTVIDRVKDMIISGGENVYPAEVEAALLELEPVAAAAVVAVPDARWGEVGTAFLVLEPGARLDEAGLRRDLEGQLARYKIPKYLQVVDELPRNATGKIRRVELRQRARTSLALDPSNLNEEPSR